MHAEMTGRTMLRNTLESLPGILCLLWAAALALATAGSQAMAEEGPPQVRYTPLFNGRDLAGWQTKGNWFVKPEGIAIEPRPGEKGWQRYDAYLTTERTYKDFVLSLEYNIPKGGNSGVFFRIKDPANPVTTGIEAQILDSHGKEKLTAHDCGGIIGAAAPSKNASKPAGEWNGMVIRCQGSSLKLWLNGEPIIDIQLDKTAMKDRPSEGHISLQDHGLPLMFRNVGIFELPASEK